MMANVRRTVRCLACLIVLALGLTMGCAKKERDEGTQVDQAQKMKQFMQAKKQGGGAAPSAAPAGGDTE